MPGEGGEGRLSQDTENKQAAGSQGRRGMWARPGEEGWGTFELHHKLKGKTMLQILEEPEEGHR